jgi:hypothetical protein
MADCVPVEAARVHWNRARRISPRAAGRSVEIHLTSSGELGLEDITEESCHSCIWELWAHLSQSFGYQFQNSAVVRGR